MQNVMLESKAEERNAELNESLEDLKTNAARNYRVRKNGIPGPG